MAEDIKVKAFEAASDLFSNTEVSGGCELGVRTLEDTETDRILAYIEPESDLLFYPSDLEGKVIDPLTGQQVELTDAFTLPDPKACSKEEFIINNPPTSLLTARNAQKAQLDNDLPLSRRKFPQTREPFSPSRQPDNDFPSTRKQFPTVQKSQAARIKQVQGDIREDTEDFETRQIFIFRSGDKPTDKPILEIKDLEIPINEAGKSVYGDNYDDLDSEEFQEQGGVVISDHEVPDVQEGKFELDSKSVSVFLNDIGLSSVFINKLQQGNFNIDSELPEINLSEYQLGHIASGFVTEDFPSYDDELDGLGIYPLSSLSDLKKISENFEF